MNLLTTRYGKTARIRALMEDCLRAGQDVEVYVRSSQDASELEHWHRALGRVAGSLHIRRPPKQKPIKIWYDEASQMTQEQWDALTEAVEKINRWGAE